MGARRLKLALVWAGAVGLIVWTVSEISVREAVATVARIPPVAVALLIVVNGMALVVFSLRLWIVLRGLDVRIDLARTVGYRLAAFGFAYFTPGPQLGGEPAQVLLLERNHGASRERAVAAVALDRLIDAVVNFGFLGIAAAVLVSPAAVVLAALAPLYLLAVARGSRPVTRLLATWSWPVVAASESEAARFFREAPREVWLAFAATVLSWVVIFVEYWLVAWALGISFGAAQLVVGLAAARLAYLLFFPAAIGALEAGQVAALAAMGLPPHLGMSVSLVIRLRDVLLGGLGVVMGLRWLAPLRRGGEEKLRWRSSTAATSGDL